VTGIAGVSRYVVRDTGGEGLVTSYGSASVCGLYTARNLPPVPLHQAFTLFIGLLHRIRDLVVQLQRLVQCSRFHLCVTEVRGVDPGGSGS